MLDNGTLNEGLILDNFPQQVAEQIVAITPSGEKDELIWNLSRGGRYSVASGYRVALSFYQPPLDALPGYMQDKSIWNLIWSLKVAQKVKICVWKLIHEGVPVRANLKKIFHAIDDTCPCCNCHQEAVSHCFITCADSVLIRNLLALPSLSRDPNHDHFAAWGCNYAKDLKALLNAKKKLSKLVISLWQIWKARILKVFEGKGLRPQEIVNSTMKLFEEVHRLNN